MEYISALALGFFGSFHCIGMCGPIALALPVNDTSNLSFFTGRVLYNIGRTVTYALLGFLFGLIGSGFELAGIQQGASIALGIIIIVAVLIPAKFKTKVTTHPIIGNVSTPLKSSIGKLFRKGTLSSLFTIGFLNGFLPCGFVYIAIAGAIAAGSPVNGIFFMFMFGLGTLPAMFAASVFRKFISIDFRQKVRRLTPVFAVLLAVIFILRGLNLGIPYLSPKMDDGVKSHQMMHH